MKKTFGFFFLFFITISGFAQAQELPKQFDLAIFGQNLDASNLQVWLKENPGINDNWVKLDNGKAATSSGDSFDTIVFQTLTTDSFAGQDIRENYIAIKIKTKDKQNS